MASGSFRLWKDHKSKDYRYIDRSLNQYFYVTGTKMLVHLYLGSYDKKGNPTDGVNTIEDFLFLETRNRRYSKDIYEIMGIYEMSDADFELSVFGFMQTDTLYIDFHMNELNERLGRRLNSGDVIELVHLRDDLVNGKEGYMSAFYVVEDARRPVGGYGPTWLPHLWRVRVSKMPNSPEYTGIIEDDEDGFINGIVNTIDNIQDKINQEAEDDIPTNGAYIDYVYNELLDGAIEPPKPVVLEDIDKGPGFPPNPTKGQYFIRDDYHPNVLYYYEDNKWQTVNYLVKNWVGPHQFTDTFVNNQKHHNVNRKKIEERGYITNPLKEDNDESEDTP